MADTRAAGLRRLWLNVHLWIALCLCALLVPISLSGGLLVWHDEIDSWLNPQRYAVSGSHTLLPPLIYLEQAEAVVADDPAKPRATAVRFPEPGWPLRVVMRTQPREAGARPRMVTVYLDPSTARVLDVVDSARHFSDFCTCSTRTSRSRSTAGARLSAGSASAC